MMGKTNLKPGDYYTQRNNKWDDPRTVVHESLIGCAPTARAMFYEGNGITIENNSDLSNDDYIMKLLRSDEAYEFAIMHYHNLTVEKKIPPNENHYMYPAWLDEVVCGKKVSRFNESGLTFDLAIDYMKDGKVLMVTGRFPEADINGHVFCLIGYDADHLLTADPYGDFRTNYRTFNGYCIPMSEEDFNCILKWGITKAYHEPI